MLTWRPEELPLLAAAIIQLALALVLASIPTQHRANRVLVVVLLARAGVKGGDWLQRATTDATTRAAADLFGSDMLLAYLSALLLFLLVFPRPRATWLERVPMTAWAGALALLVVAALPKPGAWFTPDGDPGLVTRALEVLMLLFPLGALLLVRDARRMPEGAFRSSTMLVAAALALIEIHDVAARLSGGRPNEWGYAPSVALVGFVSLVALLAHTALRARDGELRREARIFALALPLPAATGIVEAFAPAVGTFFSFVWDLALPLLLTYALLRYQLLGIELRVKWTLRQGTIAGAFVAAFFFASEVASSLLSERMGTVAGVAATAILVFALAPIQRAAERFSDAAMPRVADTPSYHQFRKLEVYKAAVESMFEDGAISDKERRALAALRAKLGIAAPDAEAIERDVAAA